MPRDGRGATDRSVGSEVGISRESDLDSDNSLLVESLLLTQRFAVIGVKTCQDPRVGGPGTVTKGAKVGKNKFQVQGVDYYGKLLVRPFIAILFFWNFVLVGSSSNLVLIGCQ